MAHNTGPASLAAARERRHQADRAAEMQTALGLVCEWANAGMSGRVDLATAAVNVAHLARAAERIMLAGEVERGRPA